MAVPPSTIQTLAAPPQYRDISTSTTGPAIGNSIKIMPSQVQHGPTDLEDETYFLEPCNDDKVRNMQLFGHKGWVRFTLLSPYRCLLL